MIKGFPDDLAGLDLHHRPPRLPAPPRSSLVRPPNPPVYLPPNPPLTFVPVTRDYGEQSKGGLIAEYQTINSR
jgi:hypothetical protein